MLEIHVVIYEFVLIGQVWPIRDIRQNRSLMGLSSLNTHAVSKRVMYSESVIKMLQHGIEKLNLSNCPILVHIFLPNFDGLQLP